MPLFIIKKIADINLPIKYKIDTNSLLVAYGQNICKPIGPKCDICKIEDLCMKVGVK